MTDNKKETKKQISEIHSDYRDGGYYSFTCTIYYYTDCGTDDIPAGSRIV